MTLKDFKKSLTHNKPPEGISMLAVALWYTAKNEWDSAHQIAQEHEGVQEFDRLHAYLHRLEGDEWNANYWYRKAGLVMPQKNVEEELEEILERFL